MSASILTREQKRAIRTMAANMTDAQLHATAKDQRQLAKNMQAGAALWLRLDHFRRRHGRRSDGG